MGVLCKEEWDVTSMEYEIIIDGDNAPPLIDGDNAPPFALDDIQCVMCGSRRGDLFFSGWVCGPCNGLQLLGLRWTAVPTFN